MSLGPPATLVTALDDSRFRKMLASLEKDTISKFKNMATAADGVLSAKSFAGATSGASRAAKAIDPLKESIRGVANSVNAMKVAYELGEKTQSQFVSGMRTAITQARALQGDLSDTSAEYNRLTNVVGISARAMATAEGNVSKLGLSQQFLLGTSSRSLGVLNSFAGIVGGLSFAGAIKGSFDYASNLEQLGVSFETILGSGEAAQSMLSELEGFASSTPFQFPELAGAAKSLAAFGVAGDDIVPTLKRVGDVASGVGAPLGDLAEIYGKARTQGRLFAEDVNQLTGRGIPIIQELAKQFGVTEGEVKGLVESGQVGFAQLEKAFVSLTSEGGKFYDLTAKQSQTTAGKLSTLADNATAAGGELLTAFLPSLNKVVDGASAVASGLSNMDPALQGVVVQGGLATAAMVPFAAGLGTVVTVYPKVVEGLKAMRIASAALLAPPSGLFVLGAAATVALGVAFYNLNKAARDNALGLERYGDAAKTAIGELQGVETTDQLVTALETIEGTLTGPAKEAWTTYKDEVVGTKDEIKDVPAAVADAISKLELVGAAAEKTVADRAQKTLGEALGRLETIAPNVPYEFKFNFETLGADTLQNQLAVINTALIDLNVLEQEHRSSVGLGDIATPYSAAVIALKDYKTNLLGTIQANDNYQAAQDRSKQLLVDLGLVAGETSTALTGTGTAGTTAATGVSKTGQAAKNAASFFDTALAATRDYAFMLSQGVQQGVRPFEGAMHLLTTALKRQESQMAALAKNGQFGANFQLAQAKAEALRQTIEELTGIQLPEPDASAFVTPLDNSAESARQAGRELRVLRDDVRDHAIAARESARENAALDAVFQQLQKDIGQVQYREAANNLDLYGEQARIAAERNRELELAARQGGNAVADTGTTIKLTADQLAAQNEAMNSVASGLQEAQANYKLTGDATQLVADKTQVYQQAIDTLISAGFDPLNPKVQEYQTKLEALEEQTARTEAAQAKLKDALSSAKSTLDEVKNAAGQIDLTEFAEGGAEAAGDYLQELIALRDKLLELKAASKGAFQQQGGNELLQAINGFIPKVDQVATGLTNVEKAANTLDDALQIFGALTDAALDFAEAMGADIPDSVETSIEAVEDLGSAAQSFLSGDIIGGIVGVIDAIAGVITSALTEIEQANAAAAKIGEEKAREFVSIGYGGAIDFDEASYNEYLDYLEAVKQNGEDIANQFYEVDEQGNVTFDSEGLEEYNNQQQLIIDAAEAYQEKLEEQNEAREEALDLISEIKDAESGSTSSLNDSQLEYAVDSGQINEQFAQIKQAKLDIIDAYGEYNDTLDDLATQEADLNAALASGAISQAEYNSAMASIARQRQEAYSQLGYDVGSYLEQAKSAAAEIGLSDKELYEALLTGNDAVLGALSPEERTALSAGLNAYVATFGEFPPGMAAVAQQLGYTIDQASGQILDASGNVVGATQQAGANQTAAIQGLTSQLLSILGPAAQPIIDQINALYGEQASAHKTGGDLVSQVANQGLGAAGIQSITQALLAQFGPAAQGIVDQINGLYTSQAQAHTQGGAAVGVSTQGAFSQASSALASNVSAQVSNLLAGRNALVTTTTDFFGAQASAALSGGSFLNDTIAAAAAAQNETQKRAVGSVASYLATVQGGLNKDIAKHANLESKIFSVGGLNVQKTYLAAQQGKANTIRDAANTHINFLGQVADQFYAAAAAVANAEADGFANKKRSTFGPKGFGPKAQTPIFGKKAQTSQVYETLPSEALGSYKPPEPGKIGAEKAKSGSAGKGGSGSKGSSGSGKGSSGSGSGKGSGGKKDGSTYTGGKSSEYPEGSPGWYQAKMQEIEEQIKKTASASKIRSLQAQKAKLQAAYDALMGTGKDADKSAPAGSINEIEERLSKAREAFENATTDAARAQAAERVKVLEAELKEKRKLLEDAAKDAQEAVKGTVISIESPLADLGSLQYLAESVSKSVSSLPASVTAASTGAAASVTRIPETYTSTVLPSYQAQMDVAAAMGGHVQEFRLGVQEFRLGVREMRAIFQGLGRGGSNSSIPVKAKGQGLSDMMLRGL